MSSESIVLAVTAHREQLIALQRATNEAPAGQVRVDLRIGDATASVHRGALNGLLRNLLSFATSATACAAPDALQNYINGFLRVDGVVFGGGGTENFVRAVLTGRVTA